MVGGMAMYDLNVPSINLMSVSHCLLERLHDTRNSNPQCA